MARIKLTYIGGGSTRAPGTMAALVQRGERFAGSEVVLVDLDPDHLDVVRRITERMAKARGVDIRITTTTDRAAGLADADVVLASFRPGGFEARYLDECIPAKHGVIGQETQGPGGFFMALRSINVMRGIVADIERVAPRARLVNYTNPVNIVSEAVTHQSAIPTISLCEGPIYFPGAIVRNAGLDPERLDSVLVGLNHTGWTVRHLYDGEDVIPRIRDAAAKPRGERDTTDHGERLLQLAATMGSLPSDYLYYYYFRDEAMAVAGSSSSSSRSTSSMPSSTTAARRGRSTSRTRDRCRDSRTISSSRFRPQSGRAARRRFRNRRSRGRSAVSSRCSASTRR